ncbi:DUF2291 family protein [uncultured Draconibacterium sp.]|uniref:DUF2291 family protein n=1 Tax=uncultured Draconibacterium sp. TaxID=1573823 RepID=UPI003261D1B4
MKKLFKYILGIVLALVVVYLSFDVQNLQEYQAANLKTEFNAADYALKVWTEKLPEVSKNTPEVNNLLEQLNADPEKAFAQFGRKLGIAKTHYFMLQGTGIIVEISNEYIDVVTGLNDTVQIATAFIFGNAVRDGSGQVEINDFVNMTDFNNVSIELNKLVRSKIISRLTKSAAIGKKIEFAGVAELKIDEEIPAQIKVIPVKAILSDGRSS